MRTAVALGSKKMGIHFSFSFSSSLQPACLMRLLTVPQSPTTIAAPQIILSSTSPRPSPPCTLGLPHGFLSSGGPTDLCPHSPARGPGTTAIQEGCEQTGLRDRPWDFFSINVEAGDALCLRAHRCVSPTVGLLPGWAGLAPPVSPALLHGSALLSPPASFHLSLIIFLLLSVRLIPSCSLPNFLPLYHPHPRTKALAALCLPLFLSGCLSFCPVLSLRLSTPPCLCPSMSSLSLFAPVSGWNRRRARPGCPPSTQELRRPSAPARPLPIGMCSAEARSGGNPFVISDGDGPFPGGLRPPQLPLACP